MLVRPSVYPSARFLRNSLIFSNSVFGNRYSRTLVQWMQSVSQVNLKGVKGQFERSFLNVYRFFAALLGYIRCKEFILVCYILEKNIYIYKL